MKDAGTGKVAVEQGMLAYQGAISGNLTVAPSATLLASGSVDGNVTVGGIYEESFAGLTQASATTALGTSGDYSYLHVPGTGNTFAIQSGATIDFVSSSGTQQIGLGTPEIPLVTADGGISGQFSN